MNIKDNLWDMERQFWSGGAAFMSQSIRRGNHAFPQPVGPLKKDKIIEAIVDAPRWVEVEIINAQKIKVHDEVNILTYRAVAPRQSNNERNTVGEKDISFVVLQQLHNSQIGIYR